MGAPMRAWRSDDDLGSLPMNSDCVVEASYWSSGVQIRCRVNHSHMARIREAKGLVDVPTRNPCLLGGAAQAAAECHFDGSRRAHVHDLGAGPVRAGRDAFTFRGPSLPGSLVLLPR